MEGIPLQFIDIQHIIAAKWCFFAFVFFAALSYWRKWSWPVFLSGTGLLGAAAYLIFTNDLALPLWGLRGDEITIASMFIAMAQGSFFQDFAYPSFPAFYPPLFFAVFALPGRLLGWTGPMMMKAAAAASIAVIPLGSYVLQRLAWPQKDKALPGRIAAGLLPLLLFIFIDWDALIMKPYQLIAAVAAVVWTVSLVLLVQAKKWQIKHALIFGLTGGVIFMTYYLWLTFGAMAAAVSMCWVKGKGRAKMYGQLAVTAGIALLVALPYILPLTRTYRMYGAENWQIALMTMKGLALYVPMLSVSWEGVLMLGGFVSLWYFRKLPYMRLLLLFFLSAYLWQLMGYLTVFFFEAPLQGFKGYYFLNRTVLAFALAFGLERLWVAVQKKSYAPWRTPLVACGVLLLATQMIFGTFLDDPAVQQTRVRAKTLQPQLQELVTFLQDEDVQPLTLHGGIGELHAFVAMNMYLYPNQHNSHPAARFSHRYGELKWLLTAENQEQFEQRMKMLTFGPIERFIFFKDEGSVYGVSVHLDAFPNGAKNVSHFVEKTVFAGAETVFENDKYIVLDY